MSVKLLTAHHFEFLSLNGGWTGSSVSTLVKMPHSWKSHVGAHIQEVFHVYLNKFENAVTHLFLVILGNN